MVVEDDREVAGVNCRLVSRLPGLTVVGVAATADQAREMVSTQQPRLILLDLGLPGASGISLLRRSAAPVEVIAVTAAASTTVVRAALHLGVIDYLVKPFAPERLRQSLSAFARRARTLRRPQLAQAEVDLVQASGATGLHRLPKGLKRATLAAIRSTLETSTTPLTADEVGQCVGVARVTARRYLEYLEVIGAARVERECRGPGRPRNRYLRVPRRTAE
jgi:two-component system response regulator DctR